MRAREEPSPTEPWSAGLCAGAEGVVAGRSDGGHPARRGRVPGSFDDALWAGCAARRVRPGNAAEI